MKKFILFTILLIPFIASIAQSSGDYRSVASGNWNANATWEKYDGSIWTAAITTPSSSESVYLQAGFTVTLTQNQSCNDLHINTATGSRLVSGVFTLSVYGKLRAYTGVAGTIPGTSTGTTSSSTTWINTSGGGKISIVGNSRNLTSTGEWGGNPTTWTLEIALTSSQIATCQTAIKAGSITITSGSLLMSGSSDIRPDNNSAGTGTLTIISGASLIMGTGAIQRVGTASATSHFGTFTLNSGGSLIYTSTVGALGALSVILNGTVQYSGSSSQTLVSKGNNSAGADPTTYNNLEINNSSGVTLGQSISLGGTLTLTSGNITTGSNILTIASGGSVSRTSGYIIGSLKKSSVTGSQIFDVGTSSGYTPVSMIITGTGDFTVQTVSGKHPNAVGSNVLGMYWTLTNGGITSADLQFTYLASDVTGTESNYAIGKYSSGTWSFPSTSLNTGTHTASTSGVSSFSDFTLGENSALPVELTSFTSNVIGNKVELNWRTATEVNNYGFELERLAVSNQQLAKSQGLNANSWVKIGFVEGNGNSNSPKSYSFTDEPKGGKEFNYRLKQIDNDGTYEYSDIVTTVLENISTFALEQNYPNPFNPTTMISYTIPERVNVKLKIYDMIAQQVAELVNSSQEAGHYQVTFDGSDLPSGVYFYKLEAGNFVEVKKFMLVK